jgi:hypothetical protein
MKRAAMLTVTLICGSSALAATASATHAPRVASGSTVYVSPSDASARFTHFLEHPPIGAGALHKAKLQTVPTAAQATYILSCDVVSGGTHHNKALATFAVVGSWMPLTVEMSVRDSATGDLIASQMDDIRGGSLREKQKVDFEARYCAKALALLTH